MVYSQNSNAKSKHIANIFGVYVKKEYRGQGIGKKLIENVLASVQNGQSIIKIRLTVNPEQKVAFNLYRSHGFKVVGELKQELCVANKFYDELIMEKFL